MKKTIYFFLIIALMTVFSCTLNNSDDQEINSLISELSDLLLDGYSAGKETETIKSDINTIFWYREGLENISFNADITINKDTAIAKITVSFPGTMHLIYLNDSLDTATIDKAFTDTLIRYARFVKDTVKHYHNGWRLDMITGGEITSATNGLQIDSVKFFIENKMDTVINDIHAYFKKHNIMTFEPGEQVELTVYTPNTDNLFFIHSYMRRGRFEVVNGVYKGIWNAATEPGIYRVAFDGMPESTLLDDEAEYDNTAWFIPYRVE